jgi:DNA-binding MarR family transcriptional regulator
MNIFLKEKTVSLLISLLNEKKPMYISQIAKDTDCMYPHALMVLKNFEKSGYVISEKKGRKRTYTLTPLGEKMAKELSKLVEIVSTTDEKVKERGDRLKEYGDRIEELKKQMTEGMGEKDKFMKRRVLSRMKKEIEKIKIVADKNKEKQEKLISEIEIVFKKLE